MRQFEQVLFLGNSVPGSSEAGILKLQKLLQEAIELSGGIQQPDHSDSEEAATRNKNIRHRNLHDLDNMVKDIAKALTGDEYVKKE